MYDVQGSTHDECSFKTNSDRRAIWCALFGERSAHAYKERAGSRAPTYFAGYRSTTMITPLYCML